MSTASHSNIDKITAAGVLLSIGIVFGDIGTSPLYTFSAIFKQGPAAPALVEGTLSAIFWTLMLQTTLK